MCAQLHSKGTLHTFFSAFINLVGFAVITLSALILFFHEVVHETTSSHKLTRASNFDSFRCRFMCFNLWHFVLIFFNFCYLRSSFFFCFIIFVSIDYANITTIKLSFLVYSCPTTYFTTDLFYPQES